MKSHDLLLRIARDEAQTLVDYSQMLNETDSISEEARAAVEEIMSDELNHALIALVLAKDEMNINIAADDITPDPNDIEVSSDE